MLRSRLHRLISTLSVLFFTLYLISRLPTPTALPVSGHLVIPKIQLSAPVTTLHLKNHQLETPATMVGSFSRAHNKTLLIGHVSTVFTKLAMLTIGDKFNYNQQTYQITDLVTLEKSAINMDQILAPTPIPTLVIMTCAGQSLDHGDATHRLILTAKPLDVLKS